MNKMILFIYLFIMHCMYTNMEFFMLDLMSVKHSESEGHQFLKFLKDFFFLVRDFLVVILCYFILFSAAKLFSCLSFESKQIHSLEEK